MEIERKYFVKHIPDHLEQYASYEIEQAYLCTNPVVRVRRQDDRYILTYKGAGLLSREEYNLPLTEEGYSHLLKKADGNVITKRRYKIPLNKRLTAELDIFEGSFEGLKTVEVEFESIDEANAFSAPDWFGQDVTMTGSFQNSRLSKLSEKEIQSMLAELI